VPDRLTCTISRSDQFFCGAATGGKWRPLICVGEGVVPIDRYDRPDRSILETIGPIPRSRLNVHAKYRSGNCNKRGHPDRSLRSIGPTGFFAERQVGGGGRPVFLEVGVIDHDAGQDYGSCRWGLTAAIPPRARTAAAADQLPYHLK